MTRLIRTELFKLRKRGMTWILLYIMIGIVILINLILFAVSKISLPNQSSGDLANLADMLNLSNSIPFTLYILSTFGAVMAVILMASTMGNEYNWRTIRIALISSESRLKFLVSKLISVVILITIGMVISLVVGAIMGIVTNAMGHTLNFGFFTGSYLWDQFLQFWRTLFIIITFTSMGFLFSVVGRSAMPGIAIGVGILFLEPIITSFMNLARGWVSSIPKFLFSANVNAINALNKLPGGSGGLFGGGTTVQTPSVTHAFIVLGAFVAIFLAVTFYLFKKRDVTG